MLMVDFWSQPLLQPGLGAPQLLLLGLGAQQLLLLMLGLLQMWLSGLKYGLFTTRK